MENKEKIAKTINLIAFLISLLGSIFIIIKGETIEEYFHSLFFNNTTNQQVIIKTDKDTEKVILSLSEDNTNSEIANFSENKAIDNYKTPIGKQIGNIVRVVMLIILISTIVFMISIFCNADDIRFRFFFIPAIITIVLIIIYNMFFLKYKFILNTQSTIENIEYTDNSHQNVLITSYTGSNYITTKCPVKALMIKKHDSPILVTYKYIPKNFLGYVLEWNAKTSQIDVLYLDEIHYSNNIDDIINSFSEENSQDFEITKKEFISYMKNSNLQFLGDYYIIATLVKILIVISLIYILRFIYKKNHKKITIVLIIIFIVVGIIPTIITSIKGVKYKYTIENVYPLVTIENDIENPEKYEIQYTVNEINEELCIDANKTQIIQINSLETAKSLYKAKKKVSSIYGWFAEGVSKSRTIYIIK